MAARKNAKPLRRLHQCLCGIVSSTYAQYRRHQQKCAEWRNRPNPRGLSIYRHDVTRQKETQARQARRDKIPTVTELESDASFKRVLTSIDMPLRVFSVFLKLLARRHAGAR
jgi:hypothetical protein